MSYSCPEQTNTRGQRCTYLIVVTPLLLAIQVLFELVCLLPCRLAMVFLLINNPVHNTSLLFALTLGFQLLGRVLLVVFIIIIIIVFEVLLSVTPGR